MSVVDCDISAANGKLRGKEVGVGVLIGVAGWATTNVEGTEKRLLGSDEEGIWMNG